MENTLIVEETGNKLVGSHLITGLTDTLLVTLACSPLRQLDENRRIAITSLIRGIQGVTTIEITEFGITAILRMSVRRHGDEKVVYNAIVELLMINKVIPNQMAWLELEEVTSQQWEAMMVSIAS